MSLFEVRMTRLDDHLDDFLRFRAVDRFKYDQSEAERLRVVGLERGIPVMELIPHKIYNHQEGRPGSTESFNICT
ncbi:hypothetical protein TNCV_1517811 [Trichonephila clavipes]|nr:hypothetical protein TNCV_1517811 [Trichonephila clavipes]